MSKKPDNNSENPVLQTEQNNDSKIDNKQEVLHETPVRRREQSRRDEVFNLMTPFPLPPKINSHSTAISQGNYAFSHDMKVIQTPYHTQYPIYNPPYIQDINHDLRAISSKIQWDRTPHKSDGQNSSYEYEEQSQQISEIIQQQYSEKQACSQQQSQSQENPQKNQSQKQKLQSYAEQSKQSVKRLGHHKKIMESYSIPEPNSLNKKVFCNCKKTKCLKLYCDCFRINQTCEGCNCMGCHNLEEYAEQRNNAILVLMDRNPDPFSIKIEADKHLKGCNCKKSFCLKKYCECYQAGLKCGQNCKCDECKNGGGSQKREKDRLEKEKCQVQQSLHIQAN